MKKKVSIALRPLQQLHGDEGALEIAARLGADAVDFSLLDQLQGRAGSIYNRSDEEIRAYFEGLGRRAGELGLEVFQTHGRMRTYLGDPEQDEAILHSARLDCLATRALGASFCVMHGVTSSVMGPDASAQRMQDVCCATFGRILPFAKEYGIKIATETFGYCAPLGCCDYFGNIGPFQEVFARICSQSGYAEHFAVCVDTGHSNDAVRFGNPPPQEVIRLLGSHIVCLHLHDNDGLADQHRIPMTGTIDWPAVFDALDEIGYQGTYNMELHLDQFGPGFEEEMAAFGIKVMRQLLFRRYGEAALSR